MCTGSPDITVSPSLEGWAVLGMAAKGRFTLQRQVAVVFPQLRVRVYSAGLGGPTAPFQKER